MNCNMNSILLLCFFSTLSLTFAQSCSNYRFPQSKTFRSCLTLPHLKANLHWNYTPSQGTVDIAYRGTPSSTSGWIAWGINLSGKTMIGTQALVAIRYPNGTLSPYTSPLTSMDVLLIPNRLSFNVSNLRAESGSDKTEIIIFATLMLPKNETTLNHVWQNGPLMDDVPQGHALDKPNKQSTGTIDFLSAQSSFPPSPPPPSPPPPSSSSPLSPSSTCSGYMFPSGKDFRSCLSLPHLNANLHWNFTASKGTVDIAYRGTPSSTSGWIAWGINLSGKTMIGTQALIAMRYANGTLSNYTSPLNSMDVLMKPGPLSFEVSNLQAESGRNNNEIIIFATLSLPRNATTVNHVWQNGPLSVDSPSRHAMDGPNIQSTGTIDFLSGQGSSSGNSKIKRKNIHGILNAISWGILMPLGAIIARHIRVFKSANPAWFYLHVFCQSSAYIIGVVGWGTGLKLGSESVGVVHSLHRQIGIALFTLGTIQMFALLLRPKPDHKYRFYWNIYHHSIGYTILILSIINIFQGFNILKPDNKWKHRYIGIIVGLGALFLILEVIRWIIVLKRKSKENNKPQYTGNERDGRTNLNA